MDYLVYSVYKDDDDFGDISFYFLGHDYDQASSRMTQVYEYLKDNVLCRIELYDGDNEFDVDVVENMTLGCISSDLSASGRKGMYMNAMVRKQNELVIETQCEVFVMPLPDNKYVLLRFDIDGDFPWLGSPAPKCKGFDNIHEARQTMRNEWHEAMAVKDEYGEFDPEYSGIHPDYAECGIETMDYQTSWVIPFRGFHPATSIKFY